MRLLLRHSLTRDVVLLAALAAVPVWSAAGSEMVTPRSPVASQKAKRQAYERWREAIRHALFVPDALPALATRHYGQFTPADGVVAERVTYGTLYGMRVPAVVYSPATPPAMKLPAIVVVNGHGGDKHSWYSFYTGILYARAGGIVLTYDPVGEGERNALHKSGTRAHDRVVNGPHTAERLSGQMISDVMQAVNYLRSREDVDASRIAVVGYSMGSFVAALTGAVDTDIRAVVLSGGGDLDGPGGYWDSSDKVMCQGRPYQALNILPDKAAVIYALNQKRGRTFVMNGTADTVVDIPHHLEPFFADLRRRTEAITGTRKDVFETYFVPGASHRPNWVTRPGALWLESVLHFPGWTEAGIRASPETHISDWAAKNHVDMDKGYIQEEREGGVMALGEGVPNVERGDLTVVPMDEWQRDRATYVYESWVERALAADGLTGEAAAAAIPARAAHR